MYIPARRMPLARIDELATAVHAPHLRSPWSTRVPRFDPFDFLLLSCHSKLSHSPLPGWSRWCSFCDAPFESPGHLRNIVIEHFRLSIECIQCYGKKQSKFIYNNIWRFCLPVSCLLTMRDRADGARERERERGREGGRGKIHGKIQ